jgi:protein-tyrosine phosphatase
VAAPVERWLALEGLDNVRDVGGLPLRDGRTTRTGVLLRSASLRHCTPADVMHLVDDFGLRLVLDLRTQREIDRDGPTALAEAGVETVALSFIPEEGRELPETEDDVDPLVRSYLGYLRDRADNVVTAVRRLAEVADYALSAERMEVLFRRWTATSGEPMPADLTPHLPRADAMAAVLGHLDAEYGTDGAGGAAGWLRANGLDEESLTRLRERLTG